ncbi:MAG: CobW family GTP-binding protein [Pseudomonadota bacterium]
MSEAVPPLTIIGGYLGAGKTTLVNHILRRSNGRRLAVMVNEFGSLPIDADLIEAEDGDLIAIAGGCVCCSYGDDLMAALAKLADLAPPPDHILLEASGVALPGSIASTVSLFGQAARLHGVVVLADAERLPEFLHDPYLSDTIERQLRAADLVVLTKTDLASPQRIEDSRTIARAHSSTSSIIESQGGDVEAALLLADFDVATVSRGSEGPHQLHLETQTLPMADAVNPDAFARSLANDPLVVRAKGHFLADPDGRALTLQLVGPRYTISEAPARTQPGVVVIRKLPQAAEEPR